MRVLPRTAILIVAVAATLTIASLMLSSSEPKEILRSLDDADRGFRDSALAEVERYIQDFDADGNSVLRWQPVWIDEGDLVAGNHLDEGAVASEFRISPFPQLSFKATQTEYRVWEVNNQASWHGVLDDGDAGSIHVTVQSDEQGRPVFLFRLRTEQHDIAVAATNVYGAYIAMDANRDGPRIR